MGVQEEGVVGTITSQADIHIQRGEMAEKDILEEAGVAQDREVIATILGSHQEDLVGHMAAGVVQVDIIKTKQNIHQVRELMERMPLVPIHSSIILEGVQEGQFQVQAQIIQAEAGVVDILQKVAMEDPAIMDP